MNKQKIQNVRKTNVGVAVHGNPKIKSNVGVALLGDPKIKKEYHNKMSYLYFSYYLFFFCKSIVYFL